MEYIFSYFFYRNMIINMKTLISTYRAVSNMTVVNLQKTKA